MKLYEFATLSTVIFGAGKAAAGLQAWLEAPEARGRLLGCWFSDLGNLNRVFVLRGFDGQEDLLAERLRTRLADNPFGCLEYLTGLELDSYLPLDFLPPVEPGAFGPVYEIRTYRPKLNGLAPTIEAWRAAVPARTAASPLTIAMHSLDGPCRFTQIWPYRSLEERSRVRAQTVADGIWPPKGGPDWLTADMASTVALPMAFSPLT